MNVVSLLLMFLCFVHCIICTCYLLFYVFYFTLSLAVDYLCYTVILKITVSTVYNAHPRPMGINMA